MFKIIRKIIIIVLLIALIGCGVLAGLGYLGYQDKVNHTSIEEKVNELRSNSNYVKLEEINPMMYKAQIAIEDKRYYDHGAIDLHATLRAVVVNVKSESLKQGGSTITQQLAKNFYFMDDNSGINKISEAFVANELEKKYSKDEILEMYLNIVYYGDNFYGIKEASIGYFNIDPINLDIAQSAMIAGMVQAPSVYALSNNDEISYTRQHQVLKAMLDQNIISEEQYNQALNKKIK